ncbi:hypothetical protein D3C80_2122690 [compost metagenome]
MAGQGAIEAGTDRPGSIEPQAFVDPWRKDVARGQAFGIAGEALGGGAQAGKPQFAARPEDL